MPDLYQYQKEDVEKMDGLSGFLNGNDPGTGKTFEAVEELKRHEASRVLIICPNSVKSVWEDTLRTFDYIGRVMVVNGTTKADVDFYDFGVLIVNWEAISRIPRLQYIEWDFVIADEVHYAKNRKAQRTKALKRLRADYKRGLTGTAIVNTPDDLWSILNWLYPKTYRSYWRFFEEHVNYKVVYPYGYKQVLGPKNVDALKAELAPIMSRRLKEDVLPELPAKYYTNLRIGLTVPQRRAYDEMKKNSLAWLEQEPADQPLPAPTVLAQLTRLRQFASGYCAVSSDGSVSMSEPSSKLDAMMELIEDMGDKPVVVFSQFKQLINLAAKRLDEAGISHDVMTGDTPEMVRGNMIRNFQDGETRVFLATIQTGGVGITLHRASTAIFLDRTWSPAQNLQAEDRLHRIGQRSAVHIINLQAMDTVDQVVEQALDRKREWFRRILG